MSIKKANHESGRRDPLTRLKHTQPGVPHKNKGWTAELARDVSVKTLVPADDPWQMQQEMKVEERVDLITGDGYVPSTTLVNTGDVRNRDGIDDWWDRSRITARYGGDANIPKIGDNNSPNHLPGRSLDGERRTYRKVYEGKDGFAIRMPSQAAMNREVEHLIANGQDPTFQIPVEAVGPSGNTIQGWVVMTKLPGNGNHWSTSFAVEEGEQETPFKAAIAEGVCAVAEARKGEVETALMKFDDILNVRQEREASKGAVAVQVNSRFITGFAYDPETREAHVMCSGKDYVKVDVDPETAQMIQTASNASQVFHAMLGFGKKAVKETGGVSEQCTSCRRMKPLSRRHMCPAGLHAAPSQYGYETEQKAREAARRVAASKGSRAAAARMVRRVTRRSSVPVAE